MITIFLVAFIHSLTYTEQFAYIVINKTLEADGVKMGMSHAELLKLDLGEYSTAHDSKKSTTYTYLKKGIRIIIDDEKDKIKRVIMNQDNYGIYGIKISETPYNQAEKILYDNGFYYPEGYTFMNKAQNINMSYDKEKVVNEIDVHVSFNVPKIVFDLFTVHFQHPLNQLI